MIPGRKCIRPACSHLMPRSAEPWLRYCSERCWNLDRMRIYLEGKRAAETAEQGGK